jgi:hypothetical protein
MPAMTPEEAIRWIAELEQRGVGLQLARSGQLAEVARLLAKRLEGDARLRQQVKGAFANKGSMESWFAAQAEEEGHGSADALKRAMYARAVRVASQNVHHDPELLACAHLQWDEQSGLTITPQNLPVIQLLEALARALESQEVPLATMNELVQSLFPSLDAAAIRQALGYTQWCLAKAAPPEPDGLEPEAVACADAKRLLDSDFFWSCTDDASPFGNDGGWDWFQRVAGPRLSAREIESELFAYLDEERGGSIELASATPPHFMDVDIAQSIVGAAFASIVLWGHRPDRLRRHAIAATALLIKAIPRDVVKETTARYERMSIVTVQAPLEVRSFRGLAR